MLLLQIGPADRWIRNLQVKSGRTVSFTKKAVGGIGHTHPILQCELKKYQNTVIEP